MGPGWLLALALLGGTPALAQDSDEDTAVIGNMWADPTKCNLRNATRLSFDDALHRSDLQGQCVAVPGWVQGDALFVDAAYARSTAALPRDEAAKVRIGLYGKWERLGGRRKSSRRVMAIGHLEHCDSWAGTQIMGYCHYVRGPVIILSQIVRD